MSKKMRFGIVGCGMIAGVHARAIEHIDGAELFGVADNSLAAANRFAQQHGVKAYADYSEMLSDENIDAVCICTPSFLHAEMAIEAMNAGKHVVVEKPMALDADSADEVIKVSDKTGKKLTVIYQLRYEDDIIKVKELVRQGAFGRITLCRLALNYYRSKEYYASSAWKGMIKYEGGGALMNQGIHGVDLMEYIMGDVKSVRGLAKTLVHNIEVEDTAVATVEFENGALGVITASSCAYPGFDRTIEIYGDSGYVVIKENSISRLMLDGKEIPVTEKDGLGVAGDPGALSYEMHQKQLVNFIRAVEGKEDLISDARAGRSAVRLINEIYKG